LIGTPADRVEEGNFLEAARVHLFNWIKRRLEGQLIFTPAWDATTNRAVTDIVPKNLLSAMWWQLWSAVRGDVDIRQCQSRACGKWFAIDADSGRGTARKVFCSDPCKSRDYRDRKERAIQLRSKGTTVEDIANQLQTDAKTIKAWVGTKGRKKS